MPRWDFKCPRCGYFNEYVFKNLAEANEHPPQCECTVVDGDCVNMERLPAAPSFTVRGYNAQNGYAK